MNNAKRPTTAIGAPQGALPARSAYSIVEVAKVTGMGRTSVYAAINRGQLVARKALGRTLILADDLDRWLHSLPTVSRMTAD